MALAEGIVGHADHHPSQITRVVARIRRRGQAVALDRRMEHHHPRAGLQRTIRVLDVDENGVVAIAHLDEAHVRRRQGCLQQIPDHRQIARHHAILDCRRELVGDQLAGMLQLVAQILQAGIGEITGQQQGQQQRRSQADRQHAGLDVPALAAAHDDAPAALRRCGRGWMCSHGLPNGCSRFLSLGRMLNEAAPFGSPAKQAVRPPVGPYNAAIAAPSGPYWMSHD
ncbi:hypothetical protein D9M71_442900 [compost metagenome]